jgi:peptidoglycan/LPS O-acetylase OafA/YrhL
MVSSAMYLFSNGIDDFRGVAAGGLFLFLSVLMVSIFSFVSIAVWTDARRKEREAYYKAESLRRLAEMPGDGAKYVIELMREEELGRRAEAHAKEIKQGEGMKIGGLINIAVGVALMALIAGTSNDHFAYLVGLFPGLIGVALLVYALFLGPKPRRD